MRFKYYLRGAGIGVIAATLILSIAFLFHDNISDEEVIRRAMKLGMVMQENSGGTLNDNAAPGISSTDLETTTAARKIPTIKTITNQQTTSHPITSQQTTSRRMISHRMIKHQIIKINRPQTSRLTISQTIILTK